MRIGHRIYDLGAGDLKDRCILLQPTSTSDGRGGSTIAYSTYDTVWCKASRLGNTRDSVTGQEIFTDGIEFTIRYSQVPIKSNWNITFNSRTYTISSITDINNRYQYLRIVAYAKKL